jgi:uncharacterized protein YbgA (DUF1722 family)/uncharacterized protein YbbK (DUF523 family)
VKAASPTPRPRIGVSACLLGRDVRYDGGHKRNPFVAGALGRFVEFVPVCPEVEAGFSVPRESLSLRASASGPRLVGNRSGADHTDRMRAYAEQRVAALATAELDGFVLKRDSPSCGVERVRLYREGDGPPVRSGTGLFAAALRRSLPTLPITEEGWLCDGARRASFLERIHAHNRLRTDLLAAPSRQKLVAFHADHKLLYMAHSPAHYTALGQLVGRLGERPLSEALDQYVAEAMAALAVPSTPGKHANVLQHVVGYFKRVLAPWEKQEILTLIEDFREGLHELAVPRTLLLHHLRRHDTAEWLARQVYFHPYPPALNAA